ncbi:MAG: N-hydroxyarylamine O-acetyltransferase [Mycobacteriales bacterium]
MDSAGVRAYLARIGIAGPVAPTAAALRELQRRHVLTVPFENLDIHLGNPIVLAEPELLSKVVERRRGGFCYELNGVFGALLAALGYHVTLLAARVGADRLGIPYDHLALLVRTPEPGPDAGPWLVDVGFGRFSRHPLRLDARGGQADPVGRFEVRPAAADADLGDWGDLEVCQDGVTQYRLELRPRRLGDFEAGCWWHQTSPTSHFTTSLTCSLPTAEGQLTLAGRRLIETAGEARTERDLGTDAEVLAAYRDRFGIELAEVPAVGRHPAPATAGRPAR